MFHRIGCSHELNQIKLLKSANVIYEWPQREADESVLSAETSSSSGLGKEEKPSKYRLIDATKYYIVEEDVSDDEDIDPKHYQTPTYQRSVNCKVSRNKGFPNEPDVGYRNFFIPRVKKPPRISPRDKISILFIRLIRISLI